MQATINVTVPDVDIVKRALQPEIESSPYKKTRTTLSTTENTITIEIDTDDIRALRGTFNAYMNWLIAILESLSL